MPTYEYRCNRCGYAFEMFHAMTADPVATCPKCSGPVTRLIGGGSAIIFKGSGFHATDYGRPNGSACSREKPCCGRETPCEHKPCMRRNQRVDWLEPADESVQSVRPDLYGKDGGSGTCLKGTL